jgi:hypothetical protein
MNLSIAKAFLAALVFVAPAWAQYDFHETFDHD